MTHAPTDTDAPPLLEERRGPLLLLTLNRPHRLNAVSEPLYRALDGALSHVAGDTSARAVVLTGAGRAFCVGADLKAHGEGPLEPRARAGYVAQAQSANRRLQESPIPVVAAVNGHAIGAGLELALSADFIVVARDAKLRLPELSLGTFVGGGVTRTLPARVGLARARELLLLSPFLSGLDAERMGLANVAVPGDEVLGRALALAGELAQQAPLPVLLARTLLRDASKMGLGELLRAEADALLRCMETEDWAEGVRAFHEKRPPRFQGR